MWETTITIITHTILRHMKTFRRFSLMAAALILAVVISSCSKDHGEDWSAYIAQPQTISASEFQQTIAGSGWEHRETHEILPDGSISSKSYYDDLVSASPVSYKFSTTDTLITYADIEGTFGFYRSTYTYDASTGTVRTPSSSVFQILSVQENRVIVKRLLYSDSEGKDHYALSSYVRMNTVDLQYYSKWTYNFDARGQLAMSIEEGDRQLTGKTLDFKVTDSNGPFTVTSPRAEAVKITVDGQSVHLELLKNGADVIVSDGTYTKALWLWTEDKSLMPKDGDYQIDLDTLYVDARGKLSLTRDGDALPDYHYFSISLKPGKENVEWDKANRKEMMMFTGEAAVNPGERSYYKSDMTVLKLLDADKLPAVGRKPVGTDSPVRIYLMNRDHHIIQMFEIHLIARS
jgi:hypothetical protein